MIGYGGRPYDDMELCPSLHVLRQLRQTMQKPSSARLSLCRASHFNSIRTWRMYA